MVRLAVILAAGLGSRLKEKIGDRPKGFLILGEKPIIQESIEKLFDVGIERIIIGIGYKGHTFQKHFQAFPEITYGENESYAYTESMHTLYLMKEQIDEDFLLLESDLIYERKALTELQNDGRSDVILGSGMTHSTDEVFIEIDNEYRLKNMSKDIGEMDNIYAEFVGISKISYKVFDKMAHYYESICHEGTKLYYEYAIAAVAKEENIFVNKIADLAWSEIDDANHLNTAEQKIYPNILKRDAYKPIN